MNLFDLDWWTTEERPVYKKKLEDIEEIVIHEAKIDKKKLYEVLKVLYDHRVID